MEWREDELSPPENRNMKRKTITNICTIPAALFLVLIGIVHSMVNFSGLRRAPARGGMPARLGASGLFFLVVFGPFFTFSLFVAPLFCSALPPGGAPAVR